jgi:hypothetical protein
MQRDAPTCGQVPRGVRMLEKSGADRPSRRLGHVSKGAVLLVANFQSSRGKLLAGPSVWFAVSYPCRLRREASQGDCSSAAWSLHERRFTHGQKQKPHLRDFTHCA